MLNNIGVVYFEDADIAALAQAESVTNGVNLYLLNKTNAKRLWMLSEEMTSISLKVEMLGENDFFKI